MAVIKRKSNADNTNSNSVDSLDHILNLINENNLDAEQVNLEGVAKLLNIQIKKDSTLEVHVSGYIKKEGEQWIIGVNSCHHINRQRFTVAHELGHFVLHSSLIEKNGPMKDTILFRHNEQNPIEASANDFASQLLMPKEKFESAIKDGKKTIDALAKHFMVSSLAVRYRARKLGYSGHGV